MAKIENASPKKSSGGYNRLVQNVQVANIFIKAQSTVISNGTELEKIISSLANTIEDLNKFIVDVENNLIANGSYLCTKKVVQKSKYKMKKHEPDFIIFIVQNSKLCYIIELKDGDAFDTKKSTSELESLKTFTNHIATQIPFKVKFYICSFNQTDKNKIVEGFKKRFTVDQVMTGKEFCDLLGINYDDIKNLREKDALANFNYIITEFSKINEVKKAVNKAKREHIKESDFYKDEEADLN